MLKKTLYIITAVLLLLGCDQKNAKAKLDYAEPVSSVDETDYERSIAGEFDARGQDKSNYEEKIIKNAYLSIRSSDIHEAYDRTIMLANKYDAVIMNSSLNNYTDIDEAQLLIKILPDHFMNLLDELGSIGKVESKTITEEDISEEYYDIKARLANARKVQDRLYTILNKASKVEDILRVENEIERVGEKIETLEGKIKYYDSKVDYSRISITIYSKKARFINLGSIGQGFKTAVQFAIHLFFYIIWAVIVIIPLIALILMLRLLILFIIRRSKANKN